MRAKACVCELLPLTFENPLAVKKNKIQKVAGPSDLLFHFEQRLKQSGVIRRGQKVFVACSGGPDSVALLHLLKTLEGPFKLRLGVLHFDHGLRGRASQADLAFVRKLARKLQIPFYAGRAKNLRRSAKTKKQSLEEAAREARYAFFVRTAKKTGARKIALGHTRDDQAETVLMRLIRGTGPRGLAGIRRVLKMKGVAFVRPLLDLTKEELLAWLRTKHLPFRRDASNDSEVYERNKIRRLFLPWLRREIHPRVTETLARLADVVEEENHLLEALSGTAWKNLKPACRAGRLAFDRQAFSAQPAAIQFRLLDRALKRLNPASGLDFETWQALKKAFLAVKDRRSLARGLDFHLTTSQIVIYNKSRLD